MDLGMIGWLGILTPIIGFVAQITIIILIVQLVRKKREGLNREREEFLRNYKLEQFVNICRDLSLSGEVNYFSIQDIERIAEEIKKTDM